VPISVHQCLKSSVWIELRVLAIFVAAPSVAFAKQSENNIPQKKPSETACVPELGLWFQVLMIRRPAGRFLIRPFPPRAFAARFFAAVILPPLLFLAIL
jgi:hypothetical protein